MTTTIWVLFAVMLGLAVVDWFMVATENTRVEYIVKPLTMVPLIAAAVIIDPAEPSMRWWFVAALVLSLAGDVFLMLPDPDRYFIPGLVSFLFAHIAYIVGLLIGGVDAAGLITGAVLVVVAALAVGPTVVIGAKERDERLPVPVAVYLLAISVMVVCIFGAGAWIGVAGAVLFYLSDLAIGWSAFVKDFKHSRLFIIVTYHLAQLLLVGSLVVAR